MSNLEYLTKSQIVLLTLFVSFVASMATGIVVVTLMQQSPEPVTKTLTQVVERTIEKITNVPPGTISAPAPTPSEEDLTVAAIDKNIKSTIAFKAVGPDGEPRSAGVGTVISSDGIVVTDAGNLGAGVLTATIGGLPYAFQVVVSEKGNTFVLGRLVPTGTSTSTPSYVPVTLGNADALKLGQTSIAIGGWDGKTIMTGLINNLDIRTVVDKDKKTETKIVSNIGVSTRPGASSNGAPIITLSGDVVGFLSIDEVAGTQAGVPAGEVKKLLAQAVKAAPAKAN